MLDIKYVAGLFDGEGCITLYIEKRRQSSPVLRIVLGSTNKEILDLLHNQFGGYISERKANIEKNYSPFWAWRQDSDKAAEFVKLIEPYLIIKRAQAKLVELYVMSKPKKGKPWDMETVNILKSAMSALNHRGNW